MNKVGLWLQYIGGLFWILLFTIFFVAALVDGKWHDMTEILDLVVFCALAYAGYFFSKRAHRELKARK